MTFDGPERLALVEVLDLLLIRCLVALLNVKSFDDICCFNLLISLDLALVALDGRLVSQLL